MFSIVLMAVQITNTTVIYSISTMHTKCINNAIFLYKKN